MKIEEKRTNLIGDYNVVEAVDCSEYYDSKPESTLVNFKVDPTLDLKEGDYIATNSIGHRYGNIFRVTKVYPTDYSKETIAAKNTAHLWVIDKIDYSRHQARIDATERQEFIMSELERKRKEFDEIKMMQMMVDADPEAKKLLDEMNSLKLTFSKDK
jgi:hypothetical protein